MVEQQFAEIRDAAVAELRGEGFTGTPSIAYSISMRYLGQNYETEVPISPESVTAEGLAQAYESFVRIHEEIYGYAIENEVIELVSFRVTASGKRASPRLSVLPESETVPVRGMREVYFRGAGYVPSQIVTRYLLQAGATLEGPCVIEEPGSTTLVEPGMTVAVLDDGQLVISL